jgi:hypothetical protein
MLTYGVDLLHDNVRPHTALLEHFNSLRVTTTCLLVPPWRNGWDHSGSRVMRSSWKVSKRTWLSSQAKDFIDTGIQKLIPRHDKCLNSGGDNAEKQLKYVRTFCIHYFFHCLFC